jgi:hypothetical protein
VAVEAPGRKPVPGKSELKRGNVPSALPERERPATEWSSLPVTTERPARARARNAVRGETGLSLELPKCTLGAGTEDAVDRAPVDALLPEPNL